MAKVMELSAIDQFAVRCYINILFCFPTKCSDNLENISSHLSKGLTSLAKDYPFLKGRVRPRTTQGYVEVCYNVDDPDPPFLTQTCHSFSHSELVKSGFNIHSGNFEVFTQSPEDRNQAIFAVKVSFIHGGCVVCLSPHHSFFDGHGSFKIIELFATYCRGMARALELCGLHDRLHLLHGSGTREAKVGTLDKEPTANENYPRSERPEDARHPTPSQTKCTGQKSPAPVVFSVSDQAARNLRTSLFPGKGNANAVSRLDVITSLLFASIMRARSFSLPADTICSINVAVDARRRLDPPLSNDYLGNVVNGACIDVPLADLLSEDEKTAMKQVANLATRLRAAILAIDDTVMRNYISMLESKPDIQEFFKDTHLEHPEASLMCSSWAAWSACGLDFGGVLSVPGAVRCFTGDYDGLRVQPRVGSEGPYEVTTVMEKAALARLNEDKLLGMWCEIRSLD